MNKIKLTVIALAAVLGIGMVSTPAFAAACADAKSCVQQGVTASGGTGGSADVGTIIKTIVNVLLYILGAVAVIMIVIGGIKYTTSNGDSNAVTSAKNTILYSVIGLVVALFAFAIVNFIVDKFA